MRIFYFITKSEIGGAQVVLYELLKAHKMRGDEVVLMSAPSGWLQEKTKELGYIFIPNIYLSNTFNLIRLLKASSTYRKAIKEIKPDIVSCHSSLAGFLGRVSLWNKYPIIFTAHGWGFSKGVPTPRKIIAIIAEKVASFFVNKIICVSEFDREQALFYKIASEKKLVCIHNGVDVNLKNNTPSKKDKITIVFSARFAKPKLQKLLIDAFDQLSDEAKNKAQVVFIGDGPLLDETKIYVKNKNLTSHVIFTGILSREKCLETMANADVSVLISSYEGFPMAIIEALQLGLPVLASDVGGIGEVVDSTVGALIPKNREKDALVEKLEEIISNDNLRETLSRNARVRGELYSVSAMSKKTFALYESIIEHR